jgi:antagonist of KipI
MLVGNGDAAVIETTLTGARFEAHGAARIAVTGADASLTIDGINALRWRSHDIADGAVIEIGNSHRGARSYLAIDGGIQVPLVLGSAATDTGAGFGGYQGRPLREGDSMPLHDPRALADTPVAAASANLPTLEYAREAIPTWGGDVILRILPGPHKATLSKAAWEAFLGQEYGISSRSTRQGMQLDGDALPLEQRTDIISAGACAGCVQITNAGTPVVLLAEHQTTGGYATVACIIAADLPLAGQATPGDRIRFVPVSPVDGAHARVERVAALRSLHPVSDGLGAGFHEGV